MLRAGQIKHLLKGGVQRSCNRHFYFKNINAGFNPYETIKFDVNGDGWSDIVVNGTPPHTQAAKIAPVAH